MQYAVFLVLIASMGGLNYYLARRVWRWIHFFVPSFSFAVPLVFFAFLTLLMMLDFFKAFSGGLQRAVSFAGSCWMGVFVYLLLFFLVSDILLILVRLLCGASAMAKCRVAAGAAATALALLVSACGMYNAHCIRTVTYDVQLSDKSVSEMTVALITDVHLGALGSESRLKKIVDEINLMQPDVVCIAGDLFDTDFRSIADPEKAIQTFKQLRTLHGVYACLGNHDAGRTFDSMEDFMRRAQICLLKDTCVTLDDGLVLAGRLDGSPIGGTGELRRGELADVLSGAKSGLPVVVLDHNPISIETYHEGVDLVLSGHTHRGQIFPGSLITNAMYAVDYGYYRNEHGVQAIVSSGSGTWGLPMRVGTHCEVVRINLHY